LYPNPVRDELTIEANIGSKIEIFNTIGHKVFEDLLLSKIRTISTKTLEKGIYIVTVYDEGRMKSSKLIKF